MKNTVKKPSWWEEFKTFAVKGNAMALAVGTIIGAAFSTITKSLTDDIIMPIVSIFLGGIDFTEMKITAAKQIIREQSATRELFSRIADLLGFSSPSYFHYTFKKVTGMTPSQYFKSVRQ